LLLSVDFLLGAVPNIVPFLQEDFFIVLHDILSQTEEVTHLQPVPDAHVPVMKFKFHGISIDLLYASVSLLVVPSVSLYLQVMSIHFFVSECAPCFCLYATFQESYMRYSNHFSYF
jgi:poly(A) polymerase Pap1